MNNAKWEMKTLNNAKYGERKYGKRKHEEREYEERKSGTNL